jgi:DNA-binding Xre family transcriptional regulator
MTVTVKRAGSVRGPTHHSIVQNMTIKLLVREVAEREGIPNPNVLAEKTGLHYETCRKIWRGQPAMIGLDTIQRICDVLGVRPGQLFEYEPEVRGGKK